MRKEGHSYKEISKGVGLSVGSCYKYSNGVKMSSAGKRRLDAKLLSERKKKRRGIKIPAKLTKPLARILGHCFFDGGVGIDGVNYANVSEKSIQEFKRDMKRVFGLNPSNELDVKSVHIVKRLFYNNRNLADFLFKISPSYSTSSKAASIPKIIFNSANLIICEFLSAFWDDEGCVKSDGSICGKTKSDLISRQLMMLHKKLGIATTRWDDSTNDAYDVYLRVDAENINKFSRMIGFKNSVVCRGKYTGLRKSDVLYIKHGNKISVGAPVAQFG